MSVELARVSYSTTKSKEKRLVMLLLSWMMENELKYTKTSCVEEVTTVKKAKRNNNSEVEEQAAKKAWMLK